MFVRVLCELFFDIFFERRITRERMIVQSVGCLLCVFERSPNTCVLFRVYYALILRNRKKFSHHRLEKIPSLPS